MIDDGGPIFPYQGFGGMSLRAHFLGEIMKGMFANSGIINTCGESSLHFVVNRSLAAADMAIAALKEQPR